MKLYPLRILVLLMLPALTGYGQVQFTQTAGPGTNPVWSFAKGNGNLLLAATAKKVFRSTDHGSTWTASSNQFTISNKGSLAFDVARTTVYLVTESGLFSSADKGSNWTSVSSLSGGNVYGVTVNASNNIFVGSYGSGVWVSTDQGATWTAHANGLPREAGINDLYPVTRVSSAPNGSVYAITQGGGVVRSNDQGSTWTMVSGLPQTVSSLAASADGTLFGTSYSGIFVSHDDGGSWTNISNTGGLEIASAVDVATDDASHAVLISSGKGLWVSKDNGATWTQTRTATSDIDNVVCVTGDGEYFFDGMANNGVFSWHDQATGWVPSSKGILTSSVPGMATDSAGRIFAIDAASGIYVSGDFGDSWTRLSDTDLVSRDMSAVCAAPNGDIYEAIYGVGLLQSKDAGANWTNLASLMPGVNKTYMLAACSAPNGSIFTSGFNGTTYRSTNNGTSWTVKRTGIPQDTVRILASNTYGVVFAICNTGVFSTLDNGETWTAGINSPTNVSAFSTIDGAAFASNPVGLFASTDSGKTWIPISTSITGGTGLIAAKGGAGYYASTLTTLQYSADGLLWKPVTFPFASAPTSMIQDGKYGVIYTATAGSGVYRSPAPKGVNGVVRGRSDSPMAPSIANYPNPFGARTMLRYELRSVAMVELTISDLAGKQIQKLVSAKQEIGTHEVTFDAESLDLASGVYLCTLRVGGESITSPIVYTKQ